MPAGDYYFTNPEAAKQNMMQIQAAAAAAENQSRERIARENSANVRAASQQRDREFKTDSEIRREAIAAQSGYRTGYGMDAETRERAQVQYATLIRSINVNDPPTKAEMAALLADPRYAQLTQDQKNNLMQERENLYKAAVLNADNGAKAAASYMAAMGKLRNKTNPVTGKPMGEDTAGLAKLYAIINADKDMFFDQSTMQVTPRHRKPREEAVPTVPSGRESISPNQDYGGASVASAVPTIGAMQKQFGAQPVAPVVRPGAAISPRQDYGGAAPIPLPSISPAQDYGGAALPPVQSAMALKPVNYEEYDNLPGGLAPTSHDMQRMQLSPEVTPFTDMSDPSRRAAPPLYGPPDHSAMFSGLPRAVPHAAMSNVLQHPGFKTLPWDQQQAILDEVDTAQRTPPRYSDLHALRPQYIPMDERYYAPQ